MSHRGRQDADDALALHLAAGKSTRDAAALAGVSERTAHRRRADPGFRAMVNRLRSDLIEDALGILSAAAIEAAATLRTLLLADSEAIRLAAARAVLDGLMKAREHITLTEQLDRLEQSVQAKLGTDHRDAC